MKSLKPNFVWGALLLLIFLRPFICQRCFLQLDIFYCLLLLLSVLLWLILTAKAGLKKSQFKFPILLFLFALAVSAAFSINIRASLWESYKFIPFFAGFYLMSRISSKQKRALLLTLVGGACLLSLYSLYQYCWGFQNILNYIKQTEPYPYAEEFLARKRVFATFLSPDMFAGYLIMVIPLAIGLFLDNLTKKGNLLKIFTGLSIFLMSVSLFLTKSIGAWISLFAAAITFLGLLFFLFPSLRPKLLLFGGIICVIIISILSWIVFMRAEYLVTYAHPQNSIIQRIYFWRSAIRIIKDFPLQGVGLGNFGLVYPYYKIPQAYETHFVHNSYLQLWLETGILGIVAWLWLSIDSFRRGLIRLKSLKGGQRYLLAGLLAASLAFLVHNLIDFDFFIPQVAFHWWVILGLIAFWPENKAENPSFS